MGMFQIESIKMAGFARLFYIECKRNKQHTHDGQDKYDAINALHSLKKRHNAIDANG